MLGVDAYGNTTPGAQVPFGFVVLQPDTERPNSFGYRSGKRTVDFSSTHRSVTTMGWELPPYEGRPWQYSTCVPHDLQGLINRTGGDGGFVKWLDDFFAQDKYEPGNEPDMLPAWLYIHAGRADRTQSLFRHLLEKYYKPGCQGLPGNDDAGAMTSWFVWASMGLYPNAGQPYYYIASPVFTKIRIDVGQGKTFIIEAPKSNITNQYIQSATLNGRPLESTWLKHTELASGGVLKLDLGPNPPAWGHGERPYSVELPHE